MKKTVLGILIFSIGLCAVETYAGPIPPGQSVGATAETEVKRRKERAIEKELTTRRAEAKVEGEEGVLPAGVTEEGKKKEQKALVREIVVGGVTLLAPEKVREITAGYEGKELSLADFQAVADAITDEYRAKGYVTSYAYIPPQKIENNTLQIAAIEGKIGNVSVTGYRWFSQRLLLNYVDAKRGDFFNYDLIRNNVRKMNEHPDVNGKVVLSRGEAPGETDVNVDVKDRFPWHITLTYNNYNSHYLNRNKYVMELRSTNFLGFGDIASGEIQLGEAGLYQLYSARYLFPITSRFNFGIYYIHIDQKLGYIAKGRNITGTGDVLTPYLSYTVFDMENFSMRLNTAFEYKNFKNEILGNLSGRDYVRTVKPGFDIDFSDPFRGRNILTEELSIGIPDIMGGMSTREDGASRRGAAGQFVKSVTNFARIQAMPFSTVLMAKASLQICNMSLPSAEQFFIGGYYSVRGYPVSEFGGDRGLTWSAEYYVPPYFIPKNIKIPYTKTSLRDALSFLAFFDWGWISDHGPRPGETKDASLYSVGWGVRFNVTDRLSFSLDQGIPLARKPSDRSKEIVYIETKVFI